MRDAWINSLVSRGTVTCQPNTVGWGNLIRLGPCASAPGSMRLPRCSTASARTAPLFRRERSNAALQLLELSEAALFFPYATRGSPRGLPQSLLDVSTIGKGQNRYAREACSQEED